MHRILKVDPTRVSFQNSFSKLPDDIKSEARAVIAALLEHPLPARLRFEKLKGYRNPNIYTVHVTRNHSHKLSFEMVGSIAVLRRVATHKQIDTAP